MDNFKCTGGRVEDGMPVYMMEYTGQKELCPVCGSGRVTRNTFVTRNLWSLDRDNHRIRLVLKLPRYKCMECNKTWLPDGYSEKNRYTDIFKNEVVKRIVFEGQSRKAVARDLGISFYDARTIVNRYFEERRKQHRYHLQKKILLFETVIQGEQRFLLICLDRSVLLDIIKKEDIGNLPEKEKVREILINTESLREDLKENFPEARISAYPFGFWDLAADVLMKEGEKAGLYQKHLREWLLEGKKKDPGQLARRALDALKFTIAYDFLKKNEDDIPALKKYNGAVKSLKTFFESLPDPELPEGFTQDRMEALKMLVGIITAEIKNYIGHFTPETVINHILYNELADYPSGDEPFEEDPGYRRVLALREINK